MGYTIINKAFPINAQKSAQNAQKIMRAVYFLVLASGAGRFSGGGSWVKPVFDLGLAR